MALLAIRLVRPNGWQWQWIAASEMATDEFSTNELPVRWLPIRWLPIRRLPMNCQIGTNESLTVDPGDLTEKSFLLQLYLPETIQESSEIFTSGT